ncbi:uncharacterized protein [Miscanthus floridulus]|uniref:uncharacterized protein isoform X3 n=1 Tax=Miscanthus floridulus TaxID=154761 RepID=UPI003458BD33
MESSVPCSGDLHMDGLVRLHASAATSSAPRTRQRRASSHPADTSGLFSLRRDSLQLDSSLPLLLAHRAPQPGPFVTVRPFYCSSTKISCVAPPFPPAARLADACPVVGPFFSCGRFIAVRVFASAKCSKSRQTPYQHILCYSKF